MFVNNLQLQGRFEKPLNRDEPAGCLIVPKSVVNAPGLQLEIRPPPVHEPSPGVPGPPCPLQVFVRDRSLIFHGAKSGLLESVCGS